MISANVVKGIHEILEERGIRPEPDEPLADVVARALGISRRQSELLLEALHDGATLEHAIAVAEISVAGVEEDFLTRIARAIGGALGRASKT